MPTLKAAFRQGAVPQCKHKDRQGQGKGQAQGQSTRCTKAQSHIRGAATQGRSERIGVIWVLALDIGVRWFMLAIWWCWWCL